MDNINNEVMDKLTKVCICKAINRKKFKDLIKNGVTDLEGLRKNTGAGSGPCKGKRCTPKILDLLSKYENGEF
ncbi:MAG: (2Fe-2S)-binding protein [Clostridiales bacterium]